MFEDYDMLDRKTEKGVAQICDLKAAWARDPEPSSFEVCSRLSEGETALA